MSIKNKWLIKSDYKILGPYSYEQVEDLIMKKQISLIDEIRDMNIRWSYVREVPDFKPLVEVVRNEIDKKSDLTQTLQTSLQRTNASNANTVTADYPKSAPEMPTFTGVDMGLNEIPAKKSTPVETSRKSRRSKANYKEIPPVVDVSPKAMSGLAKTFMAILLVVIGAVGAWYYDSSYGQNKNDKIVFQQIRKLNFYGQDDKSIDLFKTLSESSQDKILVDIIPLWPKLEASGALSSSRILDFMSKGKIIGNERKSQFQLVKFNKALGLGDIQNAKDALVKAIDLDPSSVEVKENDAVLYFAQKQYSESAKAYKALYSQLNRGGFLYGYVLNLIYSKPTLADSEQAFQMIEKHVAQHVDFNKELLFLQIYLLKKSLSLSNEIFEQYYNLFLEFPNQFATKFKRSALVSNDVNNWENLNPLRLELIQSVDNKVSQMLNLQFLLETNQWSAFSDLFQKKTLLLNENEKYNLQISYNFLKKSYQDGLQLQLNENVRSLYLSTQLYLLIMHSEAKSHSTIQLRYVNMLMKNKLLFATWAQLMTLKLPEDKDQMKALIGNDKVHANEFNPYLEYKALLNE